MTNKYVSRKFIIAFLFTVTGCSVFAFTGKMTGGDFIALVGIIMSVFTAGDTALNFIHKKNSEASNDPEGK